MNDEVNPYAAPLAQSAQIAPNVSMDGLWRDKNMLVMHKNALLPNLCVKTGVPVTEQGIKRKFSWHNPMLALLILLNVLIYLIAAIVASKKARFWFHCHQTNETSDAPEFG